MSTSAAAKRKTRSDDVTEAPADSEVRIKAADAHPSDEKPPRRAKPVKPRGFAAMDRAHVIAIAALGGIAAHKQGKAHEFSSREAAAAGKIGGRVAAERRRASKDG